jgi:hypothetical protein
MIIRPTNGTSSKKRFAIDSKVKAWPAFEDGYEPVLRRMYEIYNRE